MVASTGRFEINPRWTFGWDVLAQSDDNFSRIYEIDGHTDTNVTNQVYLTGLHDRSYFNLSANQFLIQPRQIIASANAFQDQDKQTDVLPALDYNYVTTEQTFGGEVSLNVAAFNLDRDNQDIVTPGTAIPDQRLHGIAGQSSHVSADLGWKRTFFTPSGLTLTPSASLRGDFFNVDSDPNTTAILQDGTTVRYMPTGALQASYPVLARTESSSHVFEPIAQLLVRPSLSFDGVLPNEDSQSLVFDTTTLFQHDKFSGYDRIEGGTRLNAGLRYSGIFNNGLTLSGVIGQSYHLAGRNPFAREDDLVNAGEESGLESDRSDIVASLGVGVQRSLLLNLQGRFDEDNLDLRRAEAAVEYTSKWFRVKGNYTFIEAQPDYSFSTDRQQVGFSATAEVVDNWHIFGAAQYDLESSTLVSDRVGFRYQDECFSFSLSFSAKRSSDGDTDRSIGFSVGLRTIGDFGGSLDPADFLDDSNGTGF